MTSFRHHRYSREQLLQRTHDRLQRLLAAPKEDGLLYLQSLGIANSEGGLTERYGGVDDVEVSAAQRERIAQAVEKFEGRPE